MMEKVQQLYHSCTYLSGLLVYNKWEDEFITFEVHLHCCICDLPGKALVFLHKLFHGLFGYMVFYPFLIVTIHVQFFPCFTSEGTVSAAMFRKHQCISGTRR